MKTITLVITLEEAQAQAEPLIEEILAEGHRACQKRVVSPRIVLEMAMNLIFSADLDMVRRNIIREATIVSCTNAFISECSLCDLARQCKDSPLTPRFNGMVISTAQ